MRFYQTSDRSRLVQSGMFILLLVTALFHLSRTHYAFALFTILMSVAQLYSLWNRYSEVTPKRLLLKPYGFKQSFLIESVLFAGPAREPDGLFVSRNDVELVLEGLPRKQYVRLAARRQEFIDELGRFSPHAKISKF